MKNPLLATLLVLTACHNDGSIGSTGDLVARNVGPDAVVPAQPRDKVDLLFMVDDSGSTAPHQKELRARFPELIKQLDNQAAAGHKASYHIGVITSDLGAPGISCGRNRGGKLQAIGAAADDGCQGPTAGNFLVYDQLTGTNNLPAGQDLPTTFSCMAEVGTEGCGFEMPLEAVYRALHDPIDENAGFLREDAALVVVLVTDEDDCSADPTSDLFTSDPALGPLTSFRCTHYGVVCDRQLVNDSSAASYANCTAATPAQGSKLTDLSKYVDFFTLPRAKGGVKEDPRDVAIVAVAAPDTAIATEELFGNDLCGVGTGDCIGLSHSCYSASDASVYGDPAVRINAVVSRLNNHLDASICDDDYSGMMTNLGGLIAMLLQAH